MSRPKAQPVRVLVVDDELQMADMIADGISDRGYSAVAVASSEVALARLRDETFDVVVTDLRMPKVDGLELLAAARKIRPDLPVLVMTAYGAIDSAIESIRQGAYHYLTKPFRMEELVLFLDRAIEEKALRRDASTLKEVLRDRLSETRILGNSKAIREAMEILLRVAKADATV